MRGTPFVPRAAASLTPRLYRGISPPLLGVTPLFAVSFWVSLLRFASSCDRGGMCRCTDGAMFGE